MKQASRILLTIFLLSSAVQAGTIYRYSEAIDGDFSDDYLNPTPVLLGLGDNLIIGGLTGASQDKDLFTLTVPAGMWLTEIRVNAFTGGVNGSFMGAQPGPTLLDSPLNYVRFGNGEIFSVPPINYVLFGESDAATTRDVMPQLVPGLPMAGQSPLPAGEYAFWLNETRVGSDFTLNYVVSSVPEPGIGLLGLLGLLFSGRRIRR